GELRSALQPNLFSLISRLWWSKQGRSQRMQPQYLEHFLLCADSTISGKTHCLSPNHWSQFLAEGY
ncbi:MAG: hypothetical protein EBV70_00940, partial [Actinobacteria bacterium]|nr:hypothetical protein [Actinomycetota bacterium]